MPKTMQRCHSVSVDVLAVSLFLKRVVVARENVVNVRSFLPCANFGIVAEVADEDCEVRLHDRVSVLNSRTCSGH